MSDKVVSFVGIVFDSRRNAEGDFDLNRCTVFGINKEEHTIISVRHSLEIFPREFINSTGGGGGPKRYRVHASPWRVMRILGSLGYQIPVTPAGLRIKLSTREGRQAVYTLTKTSFVQRAAN